jgi:hypothetical protein
MKILPAFFFLLLISCGQNDRAKMHADSIEKLLIKLPVSEKELEYLVDSSQWIYKAELDNEGIFYNWDFGISEATHHFTIDTCYLGNDSNSITVEQKLPYAYERKKENYCDKPLALRDKYILFLNSRNDPPPVPPPVISPDGTAYSVVFKYMGDDIYKLTIDTTGIMPWSEDIEIRVGQLIKAKQKH